MERYPTIIDHASVSNYSECVVEHFDMVFDIDFDTKTINSTCILDLDCKSGLNEIILDIWHLNIKQIELVQNIHEIENSPHPSAGRHHNEAESIILNYEILPFSEYGEELKITLPNNIIPTEDGTMLWIKITYIASTGPSLCWLEPEQTAGKDFPYLFTQGQSVLNRSLFPCQDTPCVRSNFTAVIYCPNNLKVAASATSLSPFEGEIDMYKSNKRMYRFSMTQRIPCYLFAFVVGNIEKADIGPRSCVYAEPCMLENARQEFEGITEQYLEVGERLYGPYLWERYDLVVMPPSFPYGGMENPRLTFVTPCIVCGDRSLTDVVAHEISHSWFGNLVTNGNWCEFWLNEGFTMFAQRRITEEVHGKSFTALEAITGWTLLEAEIKNQGVTGPLTQLRPPMERGTDPDDLYNDVPYEKGYAFVCYLRSLIDNDEERFDQWLKQYATDYQFTSITSEMMFEHYLNYFPHLKEQNIHLKEGFEFVETWLNKPGYSPYKPDFSYANELTEPADQLVERWGNYLTIDDIDATINDIENWPPYQIFYFLDECHNKMELKGNNLIIEKMGEIYGFPTAVNAEIQLRWALLAIKFQVSSALPNIKKFLVSMGKQKYTLPIYRELMKQTDEYITFANDVFQETKDQLHVTVRHYVSKILGIAVEHP